MRTWLNLNQQTRPIFHHFICPPGGAKLSLLYPLVPGGGQVKKWKIGQD